MKHYLSAFLCLIMINSITFADSPQTADSNNLSITYENVRHAFVRGEKALIEFKIINQTAHDIADADLKVDLSGLIQQSKKLNNVPRNSFVKAIFEIDTSLLKSGQYQLNCLLTCNDQNFAESNEKFIVARKWNPDRMKVWLWPHYKFGVLKPKRLLCMP